MRRSYALMREFIYRDNLCDIRRPTGIPQQRSRCGCTRVALPVSLRVADATDAPRGFASARCVAGARNAATPRCVDTGSRVAVSSNVVARDDLMPAFAEDAALAVRIGLIGVEVCIDDEVC